jgi:hypothetical protein
LGQQGFCPAKSLAPNQLHQVAVEEHQKIHNQRKSGEKNQSCRLVVVWQTISPAYPIFRNRKNESSHEPKEGHDKTGVEICDHLDPRFHRITLPASDKAPQLSDAPESFRADSKELTPIEN